MKATTMTPQQIAAAHVYDDGEHAHIIHDPNWRLSLPGYGDTLFQFVMLELSASEDCDSDDVALQRMRHARSQIDDVIAALEARITAN